MQIQKYKGINGINITQVQLSDKDVELRLFEKQKELPKNELYKMWDIDGKQRA